MIFLFSIILFLLLFLLLLNAVFFFSLQALSAFHFALILFYVTFLIPFFCARLLFFFAFLLIFLIFSPFPSPLPPVFCKALMCARNLEQIASLLLFFFLFAASSIFLFSSSSFSRSFTVLNNPNFSWKKFLTVLALSSLFFLFYSCFLSTSLIFLWASSHFRCSFCCFSFSLKSSFLRFSSSFLLFSNSFFFYF